MNTDDGRDLPETPGKQDEGLVSGLLDWRFERYLTMQLLPFFYVALVFAAVMVIIAAIGFAFMVEPMAGLLAVVVAPFVLLISVAIIRAVLEYLVMAHRIMRVVENMERIPGHVDHLSERIDIVAGKVDDITTRTEHIHGTVNMARPLLRSTRLPTRLWRAMKGES